MLTEPPQSAKENTDSLVKQSEFGCGTFWWEAKESSNHLLTSAYNFQTTFKDVHDSFN